MAGDEAPKLFTQADTGDYVEYTPPSPPAFHDTLPEEVRGSEHLKDVKDSSELARYYVDLKSNYLKPPDAPEGYEFKKPDGYDLDNESFSAFRKTAFENGVNQKQFDAIMKMDVERSQKTTASIKQAIETHRAEAEKTLKTEWGADYDKNVEAAKSVINHEKLVDADFKKFLNDTRFGDNPQVIKYFARLAKSISEDSFIKPGGGTFAKAPATGEDGRPMLQFPSMQGKA